MQNKPLLSAIAVFLLLMPFCFAQENVLIDIMPIKDRVLNNGWAEFSVSITNKGAVEDIFVLSVKEEGVDWSVLTEPTSDYTSGIVICPGKTVKTKLLLKDKGLIPSQRKPYSVEMNIRSLKENMTASAIIKIFIYSVIPPNYESDINVSANIPRYVDPRNIYSFKVSLFNNNMKDIRNLKITLESALVNREAFVQLEPLNRKAVDFTVSFDENTKPMIDTLTITVVEGNKTHYKLTQPFEIVGYRIPFDQTNVTKSFFLKYITNITLTNKDNVDEQQVFLMDKKLADNLFMISNPQARIVQKDGKEYFAWDVKLAPEESYTISIETNYRIPFYVFAILVVATIIYLYLRDPIVILKNCETVKMMEGGISEMKVILALRNRSKEKIKNVRLVDLIPRIAHVDKREEAGTLHPNRMVHTKQGAALEWTFDMDPKEERIVSYYLKSKLSILGGLRLPSAVVIIIRNGKKQKMRSNNIHVAGKSE